MEDFYVTLQSDSSSSHYPENTLTSFRNHFSEPIRLENDRYEVALVECSYVNSQAIIERKFLVRTTMSMEDPNKPVKTLKSPFGSEILSANDIAQALSDDVMSIKIKGKRAVKRCKYKDYKVQFNSKVAKILGFDAGSQKFAHDVFERIGNLSYTFTVI